MRKILALLLTVIMALSLTPCVFAVPTVIGAETKDASLDSAMNTAGETRQFVTSGSYAWQTATVDGRTCGVSNNVGVHSSDSIVTMTASLTAGDVFSFDFKISSEQGFDGLIVRANDTAIEVQTGIRDWQSFVYNVTSSGSYTFSWTYAKDDQDSDGSDCVWVDDVYAGHRPTLTSMALAPSHLTVGLGYTSPFELIPTPAGASIPPQSVVWTSADTSVATVANGVVSGVSIGMTSVTARYGNVEATATVAVAEDVIANGYNSLDLHHIMTEEAWVELGILSRTNRTIDEPPFLVEAAECVDGVIYGYAFENEAPIYFTQDLYTRTITAKAIDVMVYDMAFDYLTRTMYGVTNSPNGARILVEINTNSGSFTQVGVLDEFLMTLACTTEGQLFGIAADTGMLFKVDGDGKLTEVGLTGAVPSFLQSMAFDHNTGGLYWAFFTMVNGALDTGIASVDMVTGLASELYENTGEISGLFFEYADPGEAVRVTGVSVSPTEAELSWGETLSLEATVTPSNATNKGVNWTTSDANIATVSPAGVVRPIGNGTATITATTRDGGFTATCVVTVNDIPNYLFYEDFENGYDGHAWSRIDADGDGYNWALMEDQGYEGKKCAASQSYAADTPLTPDNWLISPTVTLTEDCTLSWWEDAQDSDYSAENYTVYIGSSTAVAPSDFTEILYNGVTPAEWGERTVSLKQYDGQDIRFAFRHHNVSDMFIMKIDLITIEANVEVTEPTPTPTSAPTPTPTPAAEMFTVTFVDWDDTVIAEVEVAEGEDAVAPADPEREDYLFYGWDGDFTNVTEDITIKATYRQFGDANLDGLLNTGDAVVILRYAVEDIEFDDYQKLVADRNKDGVVNTGDAVSVLIYCVEQ